MRSWLLLLCVRLFSTFPPAITNRTQSQPVNQLEPEVTFFYPPQGHHFSKGDKIWIGFQAMNSPNPPMLWQSPQAAWLFWQVVLEIDSREVSRWSADWITDADGVVNASVTIAPLSEVPGRHLAIVSLIPGTVTIRECRNTGVSPGCPNRPLDESAATYSDVVEFFVA